MLAWSEHRRAARSKKRIAVVRVADGLLLKPNVPQRGSLAIKGRSGKDC